MKPCTFITGLVAAFFAASSCGIPAEEKATEFGPPEKIECDSIAIGQILAPTGWTINGDKAVVVSRNTDSLFFVYRLPDFKYLYRFGFQGNGPNDFMRPRFIPDVSGQGQLLVPGLRKMSWIDLGDDKATISRTEKYEGYESPRLLVNDSIIVNFGVVPGAGELKAFYQTINTKSKQILDSTQVLLYTKALIAKTGRLNFPNLAAKAGRMAAVYADVPRIDILAVSPEGKLTLEQSKGELLTPEQINALDLANRTKGMGISGTQGTDKYIYAFSYDYESPNPPARKQLNSYMEVYDWDGNPVKKFDLGRLFSQFLVDEPRGRIYCYHYNYDFENVYVYPFSL